MCSYLGDEFYYDMSANPPGKPLEVDSSQYKKIIKMSEELYDKFKHDMQILQKKAKEVQL